MGAICSLSAVKFEPSSRCRLRLDQLERWSCVNTRYWFVERAELTLRIFLCALLASEEVGNVWNIQRIRTPQCTSQKTARNTQGALEQHHNINARYVCFVYHVAARWGRRAVANKVSALDCISAANQDWVHAGCLPSARAKSWDCVISAA